MRGERLSSVKKNYLYSVAFQILIIILPLITSPYISRVLGADLLGVQSYYFSVASYFYMFAMLGVNNYGNRSIARVRDNKEELSKTFWSIYLLQFICALLVSGAFLFYVFIIEKNNKTIAFINGLYILSGMFEINWLFFGLEKFKITVTRNVLIKVLVTVGIFLFVKTKNDLWIYSLLVCGGYAITSICLWGFVGKYIHFYRPKLKEIVRHLKPELVLFVPVIAISLYNVMDRIMVGSISNTTELGFYANAESIIVIPTSFITALGTVMMPHATNLIAKGKEEQSKYEIEKSMVFVIALSSALAFGAAAISDVFVPVFWGFEFIACAGLISGLSAKIVICAWANVIRTQYLIPKNHDREYICSIVLGALVILIMNYLLIPKMGAMGAVIGTIGAELTVSLVQTWTVRKQLPIVRYLLESVPFVIFGGMMYCIVRLTLTFIKSGVISIFIGIIAGVVSYTVIAGIYIMLSKHKVVKDIRNMIFSMLKFQVKR